MAQQVIREDSRARTTWDLLILVLVVVSCSLVPYQLAFRHHVDLAGSLAVYLIDLFFLTDIFLNFRTSYRHQGSDITDREQIARRYLRTLFPFDVMAALPFDALLLGWAGFEIGGVSIVLLLRLPRLLRIARLFVIFRRWQRQSWTNAGLLRIVKFAFVILLLTHWVACAWFLVPFMQGFPSQSWPVVEGVDDDGRIRRHHPQPEHRVPIHNAGHAAGRIDVRLHHRQYRLVTQQSRLLQGRVLESGRDGKPVPSHAARPSRYQRTRSRLL
jgi:hypothetical protein